MGFQDISLIFNLSIMNKVNNSLKQYLILPILIVIFSNCGNTNSANNNTIKKDNIADTVVVKKEIIVAAEKTQEYLPLLENNLTTDRHVNIAVVANQSSLIKNTHLVDSLLASGLNILKIFSPEHGFRGNADAGEHVGNYTDEKTGLPVISLYGNNKKPTIDNLDGIDFVIFDIQDVGVRFFTYISTMHYVMEACAELSLPLLILDRPNPNGYYVDGPVLDTAYSSFIGMHAVPVVHGMTIGEYAKMINGEGWLKNNVKCELTVISCDNYNHNMRYNLPVKPSPNLPNARSIELYPSLCFFEGTNLSLGRGTNMQFQVIGHPDLKEKGEEGFSYIPEANEGSKYPKLKGKTCYGFDFRTKEEVFENEDKLININYLLYTYELFPDKKKFFLKNNLFEKLAGNNSFKQQIIDGKTDEEIRATWQEDLDKFKNIRKKYLLYKDFE